MKIRKFFLPSVTVAIIALLFVMLWKSLTYGRPEDSSPLVGQPAPAFVLTNIYQPMHLFTEHNFKGKVSLLNVWATWCHVCAMEHDFLMELKQKHKIPIYGIVYKDDIQSVKQYLEDQGNPYVMVGDDRTGDVSINYGVYGTPETFILDKNARIVYRHVGMLSEYVWEVEMWPIIKQLQ